MKIKYNYDDLFDEAVKNVFTGICDYEMELSKTEITVILKSEHLKRIIYFNTDLWLPKISTLEDVYVAIWKELLDVLTVGLIKPEEVEAYETAIEKCKTMYTQELMKRGILYCA